MSSKIFISCPEQDVAVWTGFRAPPGTDIAALKQVTLRNCPACGHDHVWDSTTAYWLDEAQSPHAAWSGIRGPAIRNALIALAVAAVVVICFAVYHHYKASLSSPDNTAAQSTPAPPAPATAPPTAPPMAAAIAPAAAPAPANAGPQFDVLRVDPSGNAVIAGRAEPGAVVSIKDGNAVLGTATADDSGSFAYIPDKPLAAGAQQLVLSETLTGGQTILGQTSATIDVPDKAGSQPLAVITGPQGSRVVSGQGPAPGALAIGSADYDAKGHAVFSGTVRGGDKVSLSLDGAPLGTATGGPDGRWSIAAKVPKNRGTLQVTDNTDPGSKPQTAPFAMETLKKPVAAGHVVVAPGQNLWMIARQVYGRGTLYTLIYKANSHTIHDPRVLFPGQELIVPKLAPNP